MKKLLVIFTAAVLLTGTIAYSQTQRLNRTNARTHDRSDAAQKDSGRTTIPQQPKQPDRMNQQTDADPNSQINNRRTADEQKGNSTNTNGGTGNNGANTKTDNPR